METRKNHSIFLYRTALCSILVITSLIVSSFVSIEDDISGLHPRAKEKPQPINLSKKSTGSLQWNSASITPDGNFMDIEVSVLGSFYKDPGLVEFSYDEGQTWHLGQTTYLAHCTIWRTTFSYTIPRDPNCHGILARSSNYGDTLWGCLWADVDEYVEISGWGCR